MDSMQDNKVWTLVDPPEGIKLIGCKWAFKKKTNVDGNICTHKDRLVAKGYKHRQDVDFEETFLPVAMLKSIWNFLACNCFSVRIYMQLVRYFADLARSREVARRVP